jgi:hypothetical protein
LFGRRRRRQLDDYEPRTTLALKRRLNPKNPEHRKVLEALDDPDGRRAVNAWMIQRAEDDGVDVDSDRPFRDWLMDILNALKPAIIKALTKFLEDFMGGGLT